MSFNTNAKSAKQKLHYSCHAIIYPLIYLCSLLVIIDNHFYMLRWTEHQAIRLYKCTLLFKMIKNFSLIFSKNKYAFNLQSNFKKNIIIQKAPSDFLSIVLSFCNNLMEQLFSISITDNYWKLHIIARNN